ncbi:MAG: DUF1553 domain-containing protein [Planctomycetaceae bacterium]|nr:DUF1553 domain-containing protein [Planctomycetaceae bacterium]
MRVSLGLPALLIGLCGGGLFAAETPTTTAAGPATATLVPARVTLEPGSFALTGPRSRLQLLFTGFTSEQQRFDLTHAATYRSSNEQVARLEGSRVVPVGDGTATITAEAAGQSATCEITVSKFVEPQPVSFKNETQMALTRTGCNMGACHGSPSGKGGFRLSLRAYDPALDIMTLRSEFFGRRINILEPSASLLLKKPLMDVAHGGGKRLQKDSIEHRVLEQWIAEGLRLDPATEPDLVRVETLPKTLTLSSPADTQQILVLGHFSDGTVRDLTQLAEFTSSSEAVGTVDQSGLVKKVSRGETAVLARYLDQMATCEVAFLEEVPGFAWNNPPEQNFVDSRVFSKLKEMQILPSDLCTDDEFIRRVALDTLGRLPTADEAKAFADDPSPNKRAALVDRYLATDDFASFWGLKWADILRSNSKKLDAAGVHKFRRWIFEAVRDDKPMNQFAHELLTASGSTFENPPANYWRASRDPQDAVETTSQLFMGVRIQCAKCHNHPFERWTQDHYYGIAAAFTRVGRKKSPDPKEEVIYALPTGEVTQPRTGKQMKVHLLLQGDVDVPVETDRRVVFADWLTKADNPFFARSVVNRIWGHLFGRGIVEPVDDFRDSNPPSNAPLLNQLASEFVTNGFSQKWAIRTILLSRTYQLSSRTNDFNKSDELYFSHASPRLLAAEQLLDAICAVTDVAESFPGAPAGTRATQLPEPPADHYFLKVFGQPQREMACQCERSSESNLSQALQMINGPVVHNKLRADNGRIHTMMQAGKSDDEIIESLYLVGLSRRPDAEELAAAKQHLANSQDRRQGLEDVGWAVLNSKEFLFQH